MEEDEEEEEEEENRRREWRRKRRAISSRDGKEGRGHVKRTVKRRRQNYRESRWC